MRTATGLELDALKAKHQRLVYNAGVRRYSEVNPQYLGDWLVSWDISGGINANSKRGSFTFVRESVEGSLSPLMKNSQRYPGVTPLLDAGQIVSFGVTVSDVSSPGTFGANKMLFEGVINEIDVGSDDALITVHADDLGVRLEDVMIRQIREYGSKANPVPAGTVIQRMLNDWMVDPPTLVVVGDPDAGITEYRPSPQSLRSAIDKFCDEIGGWVCKYRWHEASGRDRLTLYLPDRTKETADLSIATGDSIRVEGLGVDAIGVRDAASIIWSPDGDIVEGVATDPRVPPDLRWMLFDESGNPRIDSAAKAQAMLDAVLSDTGQPLETHRSRLPGNWWVIEENDMLEFAANDVHHDAAFLGAVVEYSHSGGREAAETRVSLRGKPSGGTIRWTRRRDRARLANDIGEQTGDDVESIPGADSAVWFYTTKEGEKGFSEEGTPEESLGRYVSLTPVQEDVSEGLFRAITPDEMDNDVTLYRSVAIVNQTGLPIEAFRAWFDGTTSEGGATYSLAVDPAGAVPMDQEDPQGGESDDEETAPTPLSGSLTWSQPGDAQAGAGATIPDGYALIYHVRLVVSSADTGIITPPQFCGGPCFPAEAAA